MAMRDNALADRTTGAYAKFANRVFDLTNHPVKAWVVLFISLGITWIAWHIAESFVIQSASNRFQFETQDVRVAISRRLQNQEDVLKGGVGLFAASETVTRSEWKAYADSLNLGEDYPGLQGFGFATRVAPRDKQAFVQSMRAEGFPDFTIKPPGDRPVYFPILFLEPFDWRNQRAFGYDMFSEPTRRMAMERARDTGQPAASGTVTLVQETDEDVQRGFLLYLPVYRNRFPARTEQERRAALKGFVYSPFRTNDLMNGILGAGNRNIYFEIYDEAYAPEDLLYRSSENEGSAEDDSSAFRRISVLEFGGRAWILRFRSRPGYVSMAEHSQPLLIAAGGLLIDFLVFIVIGSIARQHRSAVRLAEDMTSELREQTSRTRAVVDTIAEGIVTMDGAGKVLTFNPAASEIFGYSSSEMIGENFGRLIKGLQSRDRENGPDQSLLKKAQFGVMRELVGVRKNGTVFPMEFTLTPMSVAHENLFTVVLRDLTERKRMEKMKDEFISVVSHELRTPLTSLVGSLQLIQSGTLGPLPEKTTHLMAVAQSNAKRLAMLVNDILDVERMESGNLEFRLEPMDMVALTRRAVLENVAYGDKYSVRFRLETDLEEAEVYGDPVRLMQVLSNLLSNAAKFSPAGEEVVVRLEQEEKGLRVAVIDHGPGIPASMQKKIFERFVQVDASDTRSKDGTGLGLSIAKAIVEKHGGRIVVNSKAGEGTTMSFVLPVADTTGAEHEGSQAATA